MSVIGAFIDEMESKLKTIKDIETVGVGVERGIGSKDCPFIRIVYQSNSPMNGRGSAGCDSAGGILEMTVQIIYGLDLKSKEISLVTHALLDLEEQIKAVLLTKYNAKGNVNFIHTATDEDRIPNLKSAISIFKVQGIR